MILKTTWINATRCGLERQAVEDAYTERLLDMFETPERAAAAKENWHRMQEPPIHHWTTYNRIAYLSSTANLLPSERGLAHFVVKFEQ